jgi:hypothetical protein
MDSERSQPPAIERWRAMLNPGYDVFWEAVQNDEKNSGVDFNNMSLMINAIEHFSRDSDQVIQAASPELTTEQIRKQICATDQYEKMTKTLEVSIDDKFLDQLIEARRPKQS